MGKAIVIELRVTCVVVVCADGSCIARLRRAGPKEDPPEDAPDVAPDASDAAAEA